MTIQEKMDALKSYFAAHPKLVLGFSGGVDSSFLFAAAKEMGAEIIPIFVKTVFQPDFELEDAQKISEKVGVPFEVLRADPLTSPDVVRNDARRCYYCKQTIFSLLRARADELGATLIDGTNASDAEDDRPGMKALREMKAESPLRLCGLTKADIRAESKKRGLVTWDKPSYACLATRVPTGTPIDKETLAKVEKAENALFALGFTDFRVRVFHGAARLQLAESQWELNKERREKTFATLHESFDTVLLDMQPRLPRE